jgi:hypothetical protein
LFCNISTQIKILAPQREFCKAFVEKKCGNGLRMRPKAVGAAHLYELSKLSYCILAFSGVKYIVGFYLTVSDYFFIIKGNKRHGI